MVRLILIFIAERQKNVFFRDVNRYVDRGIIKVCKWQVPYSKDKFFISAVLAITVQRELTIQLVNTKLDV